MRSNADGEKFDRAISTGRYPADDARKFVPQCFSFTRAANFIKNTIWTFAAVLIRFRVSRTESSKTCGGPPSYCACTSKTATMGPLGRPDMKPDWFDKRPLILLAVFTALFF